MPWSILSVFPLGFRLDPSRIQVGFHVGNSLAPAERLQLYTSGRQPQHYERL